MRLNDDQSLNAYVSAVRALCDAKGFSSDPDQFWQMFALIHTEVSEATDAYKKGEPLEAVGEELVDAVIRIFHMLSAMGVDADALFDGKMAKNWARPYRYNTVRAK
jgi:NTP pyrophosphatase (non-canonical NTP hydrolase)